MCQRAAGQQAATAKHSAPVKQPPKLPKLSQERMAAYNTYDDYSLYTKAEHYDSSDGSLYFNSRTGFLDDVYVNSFRM